MMELTKQPPLLPDEQHFEPPPICSKDDPLGPKDATTVVIEYGDYQCQFSAKADAQVKIAREQIGDRFRYVFRNFPMIGVHPKALLAAGAAEAARKQGKFWDMHEMLFANQDKLDYDYLVYYAKKLGLDVNKFTRDIEAGETVSKVRQDATGGQVAGVEATPAFFVNGRRLERYDAKVLVDAIQKAASDTDQV